MSYEYEEDSKGKGTIVLATVHLIKCNRCGEAFEYFLSGPPGGWTMEVSCKGGCGRLIYVKHLYDKKNAANLGGRGIPVLAYIPWNKEEFDGMIEKMKDMWNEEHPPKGEVLVPVQPLNSTE